MTTEIETSSPETSRRVRREGGGRRGGSVGGRTPVPQPPRRKLKRAFPPMPDRLGDEIEAIHQASLKVLSEIGMDFTLPQPATC